MSWVKLDDQFPTHPKIVAAGGDAAWLHVCALCYCATHLTDGMLPKGMVARISDRKNPAKLAARLVGVGAWIDRGGEYELHGYLDYNPSREHVETERRKAAERRANGGRASRERRPTDTSPVPSRPQPEQPTVVEEPRDSFEPDFDALWKNYPRKVDRSAALKAYQARRREGSSHEAMLRAVIAYREASDGQDRQYIKHGATFLGKGGSWCEWVNGPPADAVGDRPATIDELARPSAPGPECPNGCNHGWIDNGVYEAPCPLHPESAIA